MSFLSKLSAPEESEGEKGKSLLCKTFASAQKLHLERPNTSGLPRMSRFTVRRVNKWSLEEGAKCLLLPESYLLIQVLTPSSGPAAVYEKSKEAVVSFFWNFNESRD